jgi:hypothetical protein
MLLQCVAPRCRQLIPKSEKTQRIRDANAANAGAGVRAPPAILPLCTFVSFVVDASHALSTKHHEGKHKDADGGFCRSSL